MTSAATTRDTAGGPRSFAQTADRRTPFGGARPAALVLGVAVLVAAALLWGSADYVPLWDGRIYADCIVRAAAAPVQLGTLRCAAHPSHAYVGLLSLVQRLDPGSYPLLLATNALLFALAAAALAVILRRVYPRAESAPERLLVVAAFVVQPVFLANVVQPGLDLGATVFFLCAVAAAFARRHWAMIGFGLLATFSKESGALLYALLVAVYLGTFVLPRPWPRRLRTVVLGVALGMVVGVSIFAGSPRRGLALGAVLALAAFLVLRPRPWPAEWRALAVVRRVLPFAHLFVPVAAFVGYLAYRATLPHQPVLWTDGTGQSDNPVATLLVVTPGRVMASYLALTFVLGFLWVLALPILADTAIGLRRYLRGESPRSVPAADPDALLLLAGLAAGTLYVLTRYLTVSNARYFLPLYPLLLALTPAVLTRLGAAARWRQGFLVLLAGLFVASEVRTADPVSRGLWGTFSAGRHDLLRLTALTGECCGYGRDQLTYNLQFTAFDALEQAAFGALQPIARRRALVLDPGADWYTVGPLDARSRRTLAPAVVGDTAATALFSARGTGTTPLPDSVWYLALPFVEHAGALGALGRTHVALPADTVRAGGYAMTVVPFVRRPTAQLGLADSIALKR